ncbi:broad substrate specificity ATP-binding cassette transporter ABCG2-like [Callospermophilus lateralis]|uniref:broad substrate specificity ATP-binding cassette transporter ABCG2-like n=1 Tax=Callospermophilus lateralis TaxID=76772 RepID=UPI0040539684
MNPGLNAIVGPSVSGNTLLLDILAARKDPSGISGDVWVHEVPEDSNIPHNTGYVVQDDVVMDTLSVRENLWFSAALRLPTTMTKQEKKERINNIIKELGLEEVADSKVESKGERKKTSIGMELILDPLILFLDRPTTGLDGRTANDVFTLLKRISQQGRTIIFTIHQPCYSIFKLFDSLTILASGELMYQGPAQKALEYFQSAGFPCKFYNNPAELFLDITDGVIKRDSEDYEVYKTEMCSRTDDSEIKELAIHFSKSTFYHDTKTQLEERSRDENKRCLVRKEIPYVTSFVHQLIGLIRRSFQNFTGNPQYWATLYNGGLQKLKYAGNDVMKVKITTLSKSTDALLPNGLPVWLQQMDSAALCAPEEAICALQHNEFLGRNFCPTLNITNGNHCPGYVINYKWPLPQAVQSGFKVNISGSASYEGWAEVGAVVLSHLCAPPLLVAAVVGSSM